MGALVGALLVVLLGGLLVPHLTCRGVATPSHRYGCIAARQAQLLCCWKHWSEDCWEHYWEDCRVYRWKYCSDDCWEDRWEHCWEHCKDTTQWRDALIPV